MILDEIRSEYLAIRFQSKFAHSSGFLINRYKKLRQNFNTKINNAWFVVVKHCVQNLEICHIKSKILCPQHFKDKSTLENNIHRAKECSKIWEVLGSFHFSSNGVWES